jgi:DNA-binding winged helix-turn-helix (wHTH) protein
MGERQRGRRLWERAADPALRRLWKIRGSRQHSVQDGIRFRRFVISPGGRLLFRDGKPIEIGSRAFDLLIILLNSRGSVVTKEQIVRHVWPSTVVEESNLRWQMGALRKALGEDRDVIKTIQGRGYLLLSEAEKVGDEAERSELPQHQSELAHKILNVWTRISVRILPRLANR